MNANTLNRLIRERVYGWVSVIAPTHWACASAGNPDEAWRLPDGDVVCKRCQGAGEFATDANQALEALNRTCPDGWSIESMPFHPTMRLRYTVRQSCGNAWAANEDLALAICLCALKAAGVTDEELNA